jgi:hypothetical protein
VPPKPSKQTNAHFKNGVMPIRFRKIFMVPLRIAEVSNHFGQGLAMSAHPIWASPFFHHPIADHTSIDPQGQ